MACPVTLCPASSCRSSVLPVSSQHTDQVGAGKTTLLNFLSGREISNNLVKTGIIAANGVPKEQIPTFSALSCYVQQDDILFQTMTVRECLEFAAKLKLNGTWEYKLGRVDEMITRLKLTKC
jgi:ABC-type multidrug transport system ATPase subunit